MLWSILIAAIPARYHSAQELLHSLLENQSVARMPDVELLYMMDNRRRSVGAKRNALLEIALGEYISFVDDDDMVAPNYVEKLHAAIVKGRRADPTIDVICFPQRAILSPAGVIHECTYSLGYYRQREPNQRRVLTAGDTENVLNWSGPPAHTMIWRRDVVKDVLFPEKNFGEDVSWVDAACELAKTEMVFDGSPMYFYQYSEKGTATR